MAKVVTVLGVDPSSQKIAVVESSAKSRDKPTLHATHFELEAHEEKVNEAFDFAFDLFYSVRERDGVPPRVFIEAPIQGVGGPGATVPQAFVTGAIMAAAGQAGVPIKLVNNQTWKKKGLGKGNINKDQVRALIKELWPTLYNMVPIMDKGEFKGLPDQDLIDAGGINRYGWDYVEMIERIKRRRENG